MNIHMKTDTWFRDLAIVLGLTVAASVVGSIILLLLGRTIPDVLLALGTVAGAGLVKILISPLNDELIG
jgi:hypothetical protein